MRIHLLGQPLHLVYAANNATPYNVFQCGWLSDRESLRLDF